jgi:hypothetical protein
MSGPVITYTPRPDATSQTERSTLANVYAFAIKSSQAKIKAGGSNAGPNDATEVENACTANEKYTRT